MKIENLKEIKKAIKTFTGSSWVSIAIAILQATVVLTAGYQFFKTTEDSICHDFNQKQLVKAAEASGKIKQYFETVSAPLKSLGRIPHINKFDENATRQVISLELIALKNMGATNISILDSKGILRYSVNAKELEGEDFSWRKYYRETRRITSSSGYFIQFAQLKETKPYQSGVLVATPMFELPQGNDLSHAVVSQGNALSPVVGKFAGIILCTLNLDVLVKKFLVPLKISERGHAFLIDNDQNTLWMPDNFLIGENIFRKSMDFPLFQNVLADMKAGNSGTAECSYYRFDESNGKQTEEIEKKLIAYVPLHIGKTQLALGTWSPKEDAKALIRTVYAKKLLLIGTVILIILLGPAYSLTISFLRGKTLEDKVDSKDSDFKQSHQRLLTVLDGLDAIVSVSNMDTQELLFVNKYFQDTFSSGAGKASWQVLQAGKYGPYDFCANDKLLTPEGKPEGVHISEFNDSVSGKWYEVHDRAISWVDGSIVRLQIATDITDRKIAESELKQAHKEMERFCKILKQIGKQQSLDGVGAFLMIELQRILSTSFMRLFVFSSDRSTLFALSDRGTESIKDKELVEVASDTLKGLTGVNISPKKSFKPPLVPDHFPENGRQTIIPLYDGDRLDGACIVVCAQDCLCDETELNMVALILEQASGTIKRAVMHEEELSSLQAKLGKTEAFGGIIGKDPKMQTIYKLIEDIAPTDATVLVQGESGTGKELVANAIHLESPRKDKPFIVINCAAYPDTLLESELFGHEQGAFTGASRQKAGRFEQANDGTVFLDEIGEISHSAQIKLLRVLQTREFERVGGELTLSVDVRIIAATNKDLFLEVQNGNFREDLFYRLNVIPIQIPPLRLRPNDIPILIRHFQHKFASQQGEESNGFSSDAMRKLLDYHWPGNVRELENSVEHSVVLAKGSRIETIHLPAILCDNSKASAPNGLHGTIVENEKKLLLDVLEECNWNKKQTAIRLGISRSALYGKLKRYKISKTPA